MVLHLLINPLELRFCLPRPVISEFQFLNRLPADKKATLETQF